MMIERIVTQLVDRRVDQVRVVPVTLADRIGLPLVEGLHRKAEHPASHRDRDVISGKVKDQREHHFGRASRAK